MACLGAAEGGIEVLDDVGAPVPPSAWSLVATPAGYRMVLHELHDPWQETWFVIRSDANEHFDHVDIAVDGPAAGSPVLVRIEGAGSIDTIVQSGSAETRLDYVQVHEDLGSVQAQSIGTLIAGRDVHGPVIATTPPNPVRGIVAVEAGRHITGPLLAEHGRIEYIAAGGSIGSAGDTVVIRSRYGIGTLACQAEAWLDMDLRTTAGTGTLWRLAAPTVDGQVLIDAMAPMLGADGDCFVQVDRFNGELRIEGGLSSEAPIIQLGEEGLAGRIIINAGNAGGAWASPVQLGAPADDGFLQLHGPVYAQPPELLGDGSVGLVPFRLHMSACEPVSGSIVSADEADLVSVTLRWYGPVSWPGGVPLVVEHRRLDGGGWESAPGGHFLFLPVADDPTALVVESAAPGLGFVPGWEYRLRPTGALVGDLPLAPAVAMDDAWTVEIDGSATCFGDVDGDAGVGVTDLLVLLACWGEVDGPLAATSDLDGDGTVDVLDLLALLGAWGPCAP
ncbi:MAG: hypothetical protein P8K80_00295 [Phycisphaerales bacterium]|nr:hypothetical protein [Phycisphaerales bacterium]